MNLKDIQVIVRIRQQDFAIPVEHVREMISLPECTHLPRLPDYARGVINLRDRVLPVVDMRRLMGLATAQSEAESLVVNLFQETYRMVRKNVREIGVILFSGDHEAVFAVDSVLAVETLEESSGEALEGIPPCTQSARYFQGIGKRRCDKSLVLLTDPDPLLGCIQTA